MGYGLEVTTSIAHFPPAPIDANIQESTDPTLLVVSCTGFHTAQQHNSRAAYRTAALSQRYNECDKLSY
jgi:predicted metal-dependent phosphotriesterase family hydrolase